MAKSRYSEGASANDKKAFAQYLSEDEELIIATGFGRTYLRQQFVVALILPGALFILAGALLGQYYFKWENFAYSLSLGLLFSIIFSFFKTVWTYNANRYILTTRRVILKKGILTVKLITALYDKITHIEMDQSLYDRIFLHHGNIKIHTAGSDKDEILLKYVEYPVEFKNLLERLINKEREHYTRGSNSVVAVEGEVVEE